jgi:hypothetical protein
MFTGTVIVLEQSNIIFVRVQGRSHPIAGCGIAKLTKKSLSTFRTQRLLFIVFDATSSTETRLLTQRWIEYSYPQVFGCW